MMTTRPDPLAAFDRAARTRFAQERLEMALGRPSAEPPTARGDLVHRLIKVIVAQNTSKGNQARALARLRQQFPDPALIAEAPLVDVIDAIYPAGLANSKAPRLQQMIAQLLEATDGTLDLDWLYEAPLDEAMAFLTGLSGIGPLSASLVLLFGLGRPVLPVNTGLLRVALRVGMLPPGTSAERAPAVLQAALADDEVYAFHINMVHVARHICLASRPQCGACPLAIGCEWAGAVSFER